MKKSGVMEHPGSPDARSFRYVIKAGMVNSQEIAGSCLFFRVWVGAFRMVNGGGRFRDWIVEFL